VSLVASEQTEQFTLLWTLLALIVVGNSAVLAALLCNHKGRKSRMNFFIVHLALAGMQTHFLLNQTINFSFIRTHFPFPPIPITFRNNSPLKALCSLPTSYAKNSCNFNNQPI
jgi:hypothetical protein